MLSTPKILLIGGSGQVGTSFLSKLGSGALPTSRVPREEWLQLDLADVEDASSLSMLEQHPLSAIYCVGGMTYVDGCEDQPDLAFRINARAPGVLADYSRRQNIPFVFFSTEYVFDGSDNDPGPYAESAVPRPLNVYGRTKLEGEQRVLQNYPEALVLRTTVVFGPDPRQKNFVYTVINQLRQGLTLDVPNDQVSTPTYNRDLVKATQGLVEAGASGIFHVCGPDVLTRYEFARVIARTFSLETTLLRSVETNSLQQRAVRPLKAGLDSTKLRRAFPSLGPESVTESLADCAAELFAIV